METSKSGKQREKRRKNRKPKTVGNHKWCNVHVTGIPGGKEQNRSSIWNNNAQEFPQINVRDQTTDPGSSENTKQDKCQKATFRDIFKLQKSKGKEKKSWKKPEGENNLST